MANTSFSLSSIGRALQNIIQNIPVIRTGGYVTLPTSPQNLQASVAGILAGIHKLFHPIQEQPMKITTSGEVIPKSGSVEAMTPQFTGTTQSFQSTSTPSTTTTTTKTSGGVAPSPAAQTAKATIATPTPAPTPAATPPMTTTPATARTGGMPTPPPAAGYSAPAPANLPPTPVMPGEMAQPTTPENLARYEAMIRALQELAGGAKYVPMPAIGAEPFGPAGALERALRRLREREVRV